MTTPTVKISAMIKYHVPSHMTDQGS